MPSFIEVTSTRQPFISQYLLYILNRSPAKIAASSPPVPPLISTMAFLASSGSAGISKSLISSSMGATCGSNSSSSALAISRISASVSVWSNSFASAMCAKRVLYRLPAFTICSKSRYSLFNLTKRRISAITEGSVMSVDTSSNLWYKPSIFSNNELSAMCFFD